MQSNTPMTIRSTMLFLAIAVLVSGAVATRIAARRQQSALAADTERLIRAGAADGAVAPRGAQDLGDLPAPVRQYLRLALPSPTHIQEVHIRQIGSLRTDATSERWMSFTAEHLVVPASTGFVWNARIQVAPLVHVRVRDALIDGSGSGQVSLMSAFTVGASAGGIEMNSGSLHRYLAEAVWYPTALLPGPALRWTAIDATSALATVTSHGVSVSLEFRFAENGEVTGIYTPARWGTFPGGYRQVAWEGHFRDYRHRGGVVVPTAGEVGWYVDDEWRAVWKGVVVAYDLRTRS
jgi:hypothetical protein